MIVTILTKVLLPLSLAIIMFGMGMTLVPKDFTRITKYPKAAFIGIMNQLVFLPIIGFSLAIAFGLDATMAIGLMILAAAPGGPTSNLITQICRGNIALSVTLTAIVSFATILTIPMILSYALDYFGADSNVIKELPVFDIILQVLVIIVIPISIGMFVRRKKPAFATRMENPMRTASSVIFVFIFAAIVVAKWKFLGDAMKQVGLVTLLLNVATMALGYLTARLFKLNLKDSITITVESGIQNGTLAIVIATTVLNNLDMAIPIVAYSIWMFITGSILMWYFGSRRNNSIDQ
ncbi:bile acid:sodium symporter family protein [Kordia sp.]|uniref:bile acid:sodium symporter family protein n=1 Tax=Kordia sp. TaxID=1965332 RepID=UPI0025C6D7C0|nr:bile acid:sodium symporter family protein [Kordia sp.]MCH2193956.1 bile acid:sodium symporter family protein [Kordia sp.]